MWRHGVAGMVVTALVLMPGLATTCLAACLRQTPATASGAAPVHDCRDHAGAVHWSGTVSRLSGADRPVVSASEPPHQCPLAVGALTARHVRSTHGPPGASGVVTPRVLRI